jgi:hypothetical protein
MDTNACCWTTSRRCNRKPGNRLRRASPLPDQEPSNSTVRIVSKAFNQNQKLKLIKLEVGKGAAPLLFELLSTRLRHHGRIQILREKFDVALHAIHLVTRLREAVVLARINYKLHRHLHLL